MSESNNKKKLCSTPTFITRAWLNQARQICTQRAQPSLPGDAESARQKMRTLVRRRRNHGTQVKKAKNKTAGTRREKGAERK
jgi:hypothetical protein